MDATQLSQALKYHELGLNTIPLYRPGEIDRDGKESDGKRPRVGFRQWFYRPQTQAEVHRIFDLSAENNIGIITGVGSKNLLILDFDSREAYVELSRRNPFFQGLVSNTIVTKSYRGMHVWIFTDRVAACGRCPDLPVDFKGHGGYAAEPHSIYKRDEQIGCYLFEQWNEIAYVPIADLAFLGVRPHIVGEYDRTLGLGARGWEILQGEKGGYPSRSHAESALVLTLVKNGEPFDYIAEVFRRFANAKTHYKSHSDPAWYLRHTYETAFQYYQNNIRPFDRRVTEAMRVAQQLNYRSHSDRAVLLCVLQLTRKTGHPFLDLPIRQLAEMSGTSYQTVARSLHRLRESGILNLESESTQSRGSRYGIELGKIVGLAGKLDPSEGVAISKMRQSKTRLLRPGLSHDGNKVPVNPERTVGKDVYAHLALGKTGERIVGFLNSRVGQWLSVGEIRRATDTGYNTVDRKLRRLGELVEVRKEGRVSRYRVRREIRAEELDRIAEIAGTAGRRERMQKKHEEERRQYRVQGRRNIGDLEEVGK